MFQALLEQDQSSYAAISILKGMDALEGQVKST